MTTPAVTFPVAVSRKPVAIDDGIMRAGTQTAAFDSDQPETLFRNYLRLIRRARSQQRAPEISLRREDVEAISEYLGVTAEHVLNRLATLMGSSRTQRTTMLAAFASGALLFGLAGSVAATSSTADTNLVSAAEAIPPPAAATIDSSPTNGPAEARVPEPTPNPSLGSSPARAVERTSTVVVGDVGADQPAAIVVVDIAPSPPLVNSGSPPLVNSGDSGGPTSGSTGGSNTGGSANNTDVSLVTPVVPIDTDTVAVGDAVVPPIASVPVADDSSNPAPPSQDDSGVGAEQPPVDDGVPQELPPVDDDTVAVGSPPLPPTTPPATTTTTTTSTTTTTTTVPAATTTTTTAPATTTTTTPATTTTEPPGTTVPVDTTP
ncbi:MAG TPA: hypothetical protein VMM60_10210 [Ilumatobacter sp.]|nr:hypothetical protein [Ilumatobacter sp.]